MSVASSRPLVSVVITTWNKADYLRETLESAIAQTYRPLEIVVVDDGSTDHTAEVCAAFGNQVRYIHQEKDDKGGSTAIVRVYSAARGDYLATLDHDDRWLPDKIERQVTVMQQRPELGAVFTRFRLIDDAGRDKGVSDLIGPSGEVFHALLKGNRYCYSSALFPRAVFDVIGEQKAFDEGIGLGDWDLWLRLARHYPVEVIDDVLTEYRVHERSYSANHKRMAMATWRTLDRRRGELHPDCEACRKGFAAGMRTVSTAWLGHFHQCVRERRLAEGFSSLRQAIRVSPRALLNPRQPLVLAKTVAIAAIAFSRKDRGRTSSALVN